MCVEYSLNRRDERILKYQHQKIQDFTQIPSNSSYFVIASSEFYIDRIHILSPKTSLCSGVDCDNVAPRCFPLKALWLHETIYLPSNALAPLDTRACTHHIPSRSHQKGSFHLLRRSRAFHLPARKTRSVLPCKEP